MRGKKAFEWMGETTGRLILAAIILGILFGLSYKLYSMTTGKSDLKKAEENLAEIETQLEQAKTNEKKESSALIFGPNNWFITFWTESNMICICNSESCEELEKCIEIETPIKPLENIEIENPPVELKIFYKENKFEFAKG